MHYASQSRTGLNWIELNCCDFLDDDNHGFEFMLTESTDGTSWIETILKRFQQKEQYILEFKEHVLAAIIMRYLVDGILNHPMSILLDKHEEGLLISIYESMAKMDPPKGNFILFPCANASANYPLPSQIYAHSAPGKAIQLQQSIIILDF